MRRFLLVLLLAGCAAQPKTQHELIVEQAKKAEPIEYNGEFVDLAVEEFSHRAEKALKEQNDYLEQYSAD